MTVANEAPADSEHPSDASGLWIWIVVLGFMFMGVVCAMAVIAAVGQ